MPANWVDLFGAALSGGLVVKLGDYLYSEFRRRSEESRSVKKLVAKHLDPILKAADEVVGKIASLAREDFRDFRHLSQPGSESFHEQVAITNILYLVAQFWARIQLLRLESLYSDLAREKTGRRIADFLSAMEAQRNRLADRAWQRAIGEALIIYRGDRAEVLTYHGFIELYSKDEQFRRWFIPVASLLRQIAHTRHRQRILVYGAIVHSFMDTLDQKHIVTRAIPAWPNKLTNRSRRELEYRVFKVYLPFVKDPERYCRVVRKKKTAPAEL